MRLIDELKTNTHDALFKDIYVDTSLVEEQKQRYIAALQQFEALYGPKEVMVISVPGRSEVGGNHTDHQHGQVLAASINMDAIAVVACSQDRTVRLKSKGYDAFEVDLNDLEVKENEKGSSQSLVRGVAAKLKESGYSIGGFEAYVTSDVLNGAGLSSSAAFEVLVANVFSHLYNEGKISQELIAKVSQYAENVYFGKPCGLMDQMACAVGGLIYISFADVQQPVVHQVQVDFKEFDHCLCIVDTKGSHADLTDEYAHIQEEMKSVAHFFGKDVLNQIAQEDFMANLVQVRSVLGDRAILRAIHWFEENQRVTQEVQALESNDFDAFKQVVKASGDSSYKYLQNVYSVKDYTKQEIALGLAISDLVLKGQGVSRVHGGGFAGTLQTFVPNALVEAYQKEMDRIFGTGACHVLNVRKYGAMRVF